MVGAEPDFATGMQAGILIDQAGNCSVESIDITGANYSKDTMSIPMDAASGLAGIAVRNLPEGSSCSITDCELDDLFNGIFFVDTPAYTPGLRRYVEFDRCVVNACGPWGAPQGQDIGHAGIRMLEAQTSDIDLLITDCTLEDNHDALEPGDAKLLLMNSRIAENENGLEFATGADTHAYVIGCEFSENHRFDPISGGVNSTPATGALMMRFPTAYDLTVRNCDFLNNQLGVFLRGAPGINGNIDLGDGVTKAVEVFPGLGLFISPNGANTFRVEATCPWDSMEDYRAPYCALFTSLDTTVQAVQNNWSHVDLSAPGVSSCTTNAADCLDTPSDSNCSQGVGPNGTVTAASFTIGPGISFDSSTGFPLPRPLDTAPTTEQLNTPRNFSTGVEYLIGGSGTGLPSIRLSLP